jgi:flagellar biosynthesis protein FlhF
METNKNLACIQLIYNQLISNEVDEKYANQIITEIEGTLKKDSSMDNILASIYQKIILKLGQSKTIQVIGNTPKFVFFIGPTGVGKTTTIAKIASKFKVNEKAKVAFVTADTYRIAAVEQLRTYANILGIPLKVVYSGEELKQAKEEFSDFDIVFVDTAGRSHRNKEQRDDIEALINTISEAEREIYLVLSATTKYRDLVKTTEAYSEIMDYSLIFTKLDETSSIGNLFNIRMLTEAPLSYATFGQNVPDDISRVDAQSIAKQLLRGQ